MPDTEIKPALTEQEWRFVKLWAAGKMISGHARGMVVNDLPDSQKHGAAAQALYGQPFGFTRGHWDAIRRAAMMDTGGVLRPLLEEAADRIAALLPPED
jgi:hypothetical protein